MKKEVRINDKSYTIKTRTPYAPKETAIPVKKQYKRSKDKKNTRDYLEELNK